jgi:hypothetical protein
LSKPINPLWWVAGLAGATILGSLVMRPAEGDRRTAHIERLEQDRAEFAAETAAAWQQTRETEAALRKAGVATPRDTAADAAAAAGEQAILEQYERRIAAERAAAGNR